MSFSFIETSMRQRVATASMAVTRTRRRQFPSLAEDVTIPLLADVGVHSALPLQIADVRGSGVCNQ